MYDVSSVLRQIKVLSWTGYVAQVREKRYLWRVLRAKPEGNRRTCIWEDDNKMDLEECDGMVWNELIGIVEELFDFCNLSSWGSHVHHHTINVYNQLQYKLRKTTG
jgi:hypothetical protein